ncbi:MAG TPA: metalloregulator ArsR/SmtB family transcription factor [Paenirhodobacter sp.]
MNEDAILKALSHPMRRQMLVWLRAPAQHFPDQRLPHELGVCAGQFARCGLPQSSVSSHLAVLTAAGLIVPEKIGQWVFYKRDEAVIARFRDRMAEL